MIIKPLENYNFKAAQVGKANMRKTGRLLIINQFQNRNFATSKTGALKHFLQREVLSFINDLNLKKRFLDGLRFVD